MILTFNKNLSVDMRYTVPFGTKLANGGSLIAPDGTLLRPIMAGNNYS